MIAPGSRKPEVALVGVKLPRTPDPLMCPTTAPKSPVLFVWARRALEPFHSPERRFRESLRVVDDAAAIGLRYSASREPIQPAVRLWNRIAQSLRQVDRVRAHNGLG